MDSLKELSDKKMKSTLSEMSDMGDPSVFCDYH